jgi:hypothetical protein
MKHLDNRLALGGLLILGGLLFLLQNLGVFIFTDLIWGIVFTVAGLCFLYVTLADRSRWWAVIPGMVLLYFGLLVFANRFLPAFAGRIGGVMFLGFIGLSFAIVYLMDRAKWWAVIPAGVMLTLMATSMAGLFDSGIISGGIFFLGLALTFTVLALLPTPAGRLRWPLIPAGILGFMGILILAASAHLMQILWPVALIILGVWLFFGRRSREY